MSKKTKKWKYFITTLHIYIYKHTKTNKGLLFNDVSQFPTLVKSVGHD